MYYYIRTNYNSIRIGIQLFKLIIQILINNKQSKTIFMGNLMF